MDKAETFEELAEVAIGVLNEMQKSGNPIALICGPVSTGGLGSMDKNLARLAKAVGTASQNCLQVFDQTPFEDAIKRIAQKYPKTDGYCLPILDLFYKKVFEAGYVNKALFLPDWQSSKGATWERKLLSDLGVKIEEYPVEWLD